MRVHVIMEHDLGEPHTGEHGAHAMSRTVHEVRTRGTWSPTVRLHDATYCAAILGPLQLVQSIGLQSSGGNSSREDWAGGTTKREAKDQPSTIFYSILIFSSNFKIRIFQ